MEDSVTVLITTYNEEKHIFSKAIESILQQTYLNIKILIIVDNKDNIEIINLIKKYKNQDSRISYVINEKNLGLPNSLNKGIDLIDTKYIARMDADDIAYANRIEKQVKFAKENQEYDLFGTNICYIDYEGNILHKRNNHSMNIEKTKKVVNYINIFEHPTFFGKTEIFKKYKYRNLRYAQDYDFVCRLLEDNHIIGNMEDCLLYYRLPKKTNTEKKYIQKMTYFCIQELYQKGMLISTDINKYLNEKIEKNKNKKEKKIRAFLIYDKALEEYKQKQYFKFVFDTIHSVILSKYQLRQIKNIVKYEIVKHNF